MATVNPLVNQGILNRVVATVQFTFLPALNVTASYLGREGISIALEGEIVRGLNTMTGAVTSPEPYVPVTTTIHLVKTLGLAAAFKAQWEFSALVGPMVITPDIPPPFGLTPFDFFNCYIRNVREMPFSGENPELVVVMGGYYYVNSLLWQGDGMQPPGVPPFFSLGA